MSAYSINRLTGDLTLLNVQPAVGAPAHVSVDQGGRYLFAAEYSGSFFEVFPILPNGSLGPAVFQVQTVDNVDTSFRTKPATNAPRGSFAFHPNGVWMYSIQEEASTIMFWDFDRAMGALSPQQIIPSVPPGFTGTAADDGLSPDSNVIT